MPNALLKALRWEPAAKPKAIDRLTAGATSSQPGANGPVYPQPDQGTGGGLDLAQYNANLAAQPGKTTEDQVKQIHDEMVARGDTHPNAVELMKLAALVPLDMVQQAISATIQGATAPKRAMTGEMQVMDPATGHASDDATSSALALTGLMSGGSVAGAPEGALASGPVKRPMPRVKPTEAELNVERRKADAMFENGDLSDAEYEALLEHVEKGGKVDQARVNQSNAEAQSALDASIKADPNFLNKQVEALRKSVTQSAEDNPDFVDPGPTKGPTLNSGSKEASLLADTASQPAFYSHAGRVVEALPTKKATANQWIATLKNKGVKDEELEALKIPPGDQVLTKDQVKTSIDVNTPQLNEVVKKGELGPGDGVFEATRQAMADNEDRPVHEITDDAVRETMHDFEGGIDDVDSKGITKYGQYQLPGGENYREILTTLPKKGGPLSSGDIANLEAKLFHDHPNWSEADIESNVQAAIKDAEGLKGNHYTSSHWDEPNVLGHMRVNDRYIPDADAKPRVAVIKNDDGTFRVEDSGAVVGDRLSQASANTVKSNMESVPESVGGPKVGIKTLHVEEMQSDWHQQGKKKGYQGNHEITDEEAKAYAEGRVSIAGFRSWNEIPQDKQRQYIDAAKQEMMQRGVPDAPFKKSWPDLLIKKIARRAVDEGYDAISWTDGATQADRYDLSKRVSRMTWMAGSDGMGVVQAFDKNDKMVIHKNAYAKELPDIIGKEAADKLVNSPTRQEPYGTVQRNILEGADLKVGGEGMKAFYDQELPRRAKKILGAPVEKKPLSTPKGLSRQAQSWIKNASETGDVKAAIVAVQDHLHTLRGASSRDVSARAELTRTEEVLAELQNYELLDPTEHPENHTVHFIRLTPEVKARIKQGFPLYSTSLPVGAETQPGPEQLDIGGKKVHVQRVNHDPFKGEKK